MKMDENQACYSSSGCKYNREPYYRQENSCGKLHMIYISGTSPSGGIQGL
ncbi:MAG: hypothetical protein ACMUHX_06370 [bacterium]